MFWIVALAITAFTALILGRTAWSGRAGAAPAALSDLQVYRDQLKEIERDLARGVIAKDEAERTRIEVSRRILAADAAAQAGRSQGGQPRAMGLVALVVVVAAMAGALGLYTVLGAPGLRDLPIQARIEASDARRANRLSQAEAEARLPAPAVSEASADFLELMDKLRDTVERRPGDIEGLALLARNEAAIGNLRAAHAAQAKLIAARGADANAGDHSYHAELLVLAASGYVSREAEAAVRTALELDPAYPYARYYLAQYLMQVDRPDAAFRVLDVLLKESRPDAPWVAPTRAIIEEVAWHAGVKYELPALPDAAPAPGPSAEDMAAASEMSDEDRQEMIRDMVARLSERLASEGGTPEEWARLIRAHGVLGNTERARAIWSEAQGVFAASDQALATVNAAARDAGLETGE